MSNSAASTGAISSTRDLPKPRGLLDFKPEWIKQLSRELPAADLEPFIEHFWGVRWDLRGQPPRLQESLPYPSAHLVFENDGSRILGVVRGRFSVLLKDNGRVFGVKFKPGGFFPFYRRPVSHLTSKTIAPEEVFGSEVTALREKIDRIEADYAESQDSRFSRMVELASTFLRKQLPEIDPNVREVNRIIDCIAGDHEITRVDHLIERLNLKKRGLQRLFSQYVGVSPKWVIQRYRLHEAIEQLADGRSVDWVKLALDLGYFDQAHFIKDFKTFVGKSPAQYARSVASS